MKYVIELDREDDYKALKDLYNERRQERDKEAFLKTTYDEIVTQLTLVEAMYGRDEAKRLIRQIHRDYRDSSPDSSSIPF